jgi:hypothetical protein
MQTENITDIAAKASIPVSVSGMTVYGVLLPDVILILTGLYTVLLIINQARIFYKWMKGKDEPKE